VQAAILAMARIEPQRIKDRLIEFLHSDEYLIHLAATRVCGWLSHKPCGPIILQSLRDYLAVGDLQDLKLPKLYIDVIANLNLREAIPDLVEIAEKQVGLRGVAVQALVEMNAEEAASILSPLLSDPSNRLRRNLIEMMIQADYQAALPLIRPLLKDNAITVRETALAAVSKWQDRVSAADVREMAFNDPNPFVRPQAVITLVKLLGQEALPDLVDLADDLNIQVRRAVAQSFAEIEYLTPEAKASLLKLAKDEEVADFTREAMISHDLDAIHSGGFDETRMRVPVPDGIKPEAKLFLNLLERWQALLPNMQRHFDLEELSKIDQALSTLIVALRKAEIKPEQ
jgi:HEAT repeat protein